MAARVKLPEADLKLNVILRFSLFWTRNLKIFCTYNRILDLGGKWKFSKFRARGDTHVNGLHRYVRPQREWFSAVSVIEYDLYVL